MQLHFKNGKWTITHVNELPHKGRIMDHRFSKNGEYCLTTGGNKRVHLWKFNLEGTLKYSPNTVFKIGLLSFMGKKGQKTVC